MAKSGLRFQAKSDRADPSYPFPSRFGADGEIIYSVPAEISSTSAFATFGISMADCSTLPFGDRQKLVYYIETTDRKFASSAGTTTGILPSRKSSKRKKMALSPTQTTRFLQRKKKVMDRQKRTTCVTG